MDDNIKKNLDIILKNGDLYDAIAIKEGVQTRFYFWEANILLISRILFACTLIAKKFLTRIKGNINQDKNISRIEEVREAQNQIRQELGIPVDIVRSKIIKKRLMLLYRAGTVELEEYINHLKKIANFCEAYHIDTIYISKSDLEKYMVENDDYIDDYINDDLKDMVEDFACKKLDGLDGIFISMKKSLQEEFLETRLKTLSWIIDELEFIKVDKCKILELGNLIQDIQINNAIEEFAKSGNLNRLKVIVEQRFTQCLNSESSDKDKVYGKVSKTLHVQGEYVSVSTSNQKGEMINHTIMTIYEYLDIPNYSSLLSHCNQRKDNNEILQIAVLHLYLCSQEKCNVCKDRKQESFLDKLYQDYQAKNQGKIKKIPSMRSKWDKNLFNIIATLGSFYLSYSVLIIGLLIGMSVEWIQHFFNKEGNFDGSKVIYFVCQQLDEMIINAIEENVGDINLDFLDITKSFAGDVSSMHNNEKIIGTVEYVDWLYDLPNYYATGYATSATYQNGKVEYTICQPSVSFSDFENTEELFCVKYDMHRKELKKSIVNSEIHLLQMLYPVGYPYAITRIDIIDKEDTNKHFEVDYQRASTQGNRISKAEEEMLMEMKNPEICYTYGTSYNFKSQFSLSMYKESYTDLPYDEIMGAITKGLGFDSYDPLLVYHAIKNKTYSETPIQDAGLSRKMKKMDEKEYYETVASLDSLVCNLAAALIVELYDDTFYVVGYKKDSNSSNIKSGNAHAWAMDENGIIIDATPSTPVEKEAESILGEAIKWGIENHVPLYTLISIIVIALQKKFGKKIATTIKIEKIRSILETKNIEETYAKMGEVLYGGIHIPKARSTSEFVKTIESEFSSFSIEELKELKQEIKAKEGDSQIKKNAIHLIDEIPYIKENAEELQKVFTNRKKI